MFKTDSSVVCWDLLDLELSNNKERALPVPLELYNRSHRGVNPQTPKRKNTWRFAAQFCVAADDDRLENYL